MSNGQSQPVLHQWHPAKLDFHRLGGQQTEIVIQVRTVYRERIECGLSQYCTGDELGIAADLPDPVHNYCCW